MLNSLHPSAHLDACPICDGRVFEDLGALGRVHYLRCTDCGANLMSDERTIAVAFADLLPVYTPMRVAAYRETAWRI